MKKQLDVEMASYRKYLVPATTENGLLCPLGLEPRVLARWLPCTVILKRESQRAVLKLAPSTRVASMQAYRKR